VAPDPGTLPIISKISMDTASYETDEEQSDESEADDTTTTGFEDTPLELFTNNAVSAFHEVDSDPVPPTTSWGESEDLPKF
jgi:hypothetical protein